MNSAPDSNILFNIDAKDPQKALNQITQFLARQYEWSKANTATIMSQLDELHNLCTKLDERQDDAEDALLRLKTKAQVWGAIGGIVFGIISSFMIRLYFS